jgi:eukaryotic-like serine/threonine-protein kinase
MGDRVGQQLGNYRLIRFLGEGGFAAVYLGEQVYLQSQAAIKVLHTRLGTDELEHFLSEARTIVRLKHPHIVRLLEFGVEETHPIWSWTMPRMERYGTAIRRGHPWPWRRCCPM